MFAPRTSRLVCAPAGHTVLTDEAPATASQLGVRDVVIYGGPGAATLPGTDQPLTKSRADYGDYLALRQRLRVAWRAPHSYRRRICSSPKYHDIVYGGPKRDQLIDELLAEIRDMGRAGVPVYGYPWMPLLVWRSTPAQIRGGTEATAFDLAKVRGATDRPSCHVLRKKLGWGS